MMYQYAATLTKVVDGDTMHFAIDLGLDIHTNMKVRVMGVNAPEMKTPEGKTARDWAVGWFTAHAPDNQVVLRTIKDRTEKYGRYLAYIETADGYSFNDDILAAHQAVPYNP